MVEPRCADCPLNGKKKIYGEGVTVLDTPEEIRDSANPQILIKQVVVDKPPDDHYQVVMVGMAPAENEEIQGRVLVGISGQILRSLLVKLGYTKVWLCNSLLCRIPDEWDDKNEKRGIAEECCRGRLLDEITSKTPDLIVAMGAMPAKELIGDYPITKIAGRVFPASFTRYGIANMLPTIHPAYVWGMPELFLDLVEQLEAGVKWLTGSYQSAVAPEMVLVLEHNMHEVLDKLDKHFTEGGIGALDLETTGGGFYPYGWHPDEIRCMVLSIDNKTSYIIPGKHCNKDNPYYEGWPELETETFYPDFIQDPRYYPRIKEVLEKGKWRTHNGQFDAGFLLQIGILIHIEFDSMLAHYCLDEREFSHSLKKLGHKYLGAPDWEEDIRDYTTKKKDSYDKVPNSKIFWYAAHDGVYTNQMSERLEAETADDWPLHNILIPSANMFNELRHRGVRIDPRELMSLDENLEIELSKAEDELNALCNEPINPNSPPEVIELIYDKLKFKPHPKYGRSGRKKALENYLPHPIPEKILECRHLGKLKNTYVEGLAKFIHPTEMRIHPFTRMMAAVTGRLATEDPSVMNVAKRGGIMRVYIPEEGHKFAVFDQKQMELRCGAIVTGDEHLREILLDPTRDPHNEAGLVAYHGDAKKAKERRGPIKTCIFGRFYGRSLESIMYAERLSKEEAKYLVEVIDGFFPDLYKYQQRIKKEIHEKGFLMSYFGRYRRFGLITKEFAAEFERMGYNFPVQSMASDVNLLCMLECYRRREEFEAVPLWPIHDAIIFDIENEKCIPKLKKFIEEYSEELVHGEMKFRTEVKTGPNWGDTMVVKDFGE